MNKKIHTVNLDSNKIVSTSDSDIIINNDSDSIFNIGDFETSFNNIDINVDGLEKPDPNTLFSTYSDKDINKFIAEDLLRIKRNKLLTESDFKVMPDYIHPSEEVKQSWITYRQALRDLPSTSTPQLDTNDQLTNVTWPTPPS